jgi:predicted restriction endonuclease
MGDFQHQIPALVQEINDDTAVERFDSALEQSIKNDTTIDSTEKQALVLARRGQGKYRSNLVQVESCCRITGVSDHRLLRASHIKPWRSCKNHHERLDGYNGLLLTPHVDHLFDRGYISFADDGAVLLSPRVDHEQLQMLGIPTDPPPHVGMFRPEQRQYLEHHRVNVYLGKPEG